MSLTISDKKVAKRASGGVLLAAAMVYFYFCDDIVLAGPIVAVAIKWGIAPAMIFGTIACAIWNVPQTMAFISEMYPTSKGVMTKYQRFETIVKTLGWFQPPIVLFVAFGWIGGVIGFVGVLLLKRLASWLAKYRQEADGQIGTKLTRLSEYIWQKHRRWLYVVLFVIGPQMALLPAMNAGAPISEVKRMGYKLIAVYAVQFTLGYVVGVSVLGWIIG